MIVFAGPSIPLDARRCDDTIDWRAPAQAGDLLELIPEAPRRVLLIDGLFDTRAAVTHKECIALMAAGTTLIGAASMGALRYAELAPLGMLGHGAIAADYASGTLVGDDEVALVHGDARIGWKAASIAMVDVRATLAKATDDGLDPTLAKTLLACWHDIHFSDRDWPAMQAAAAHLAEPALLARIAASHVKLKQRDAMDALDFAMDCPLQNPPAAPPRTRWLRQLEAEVSARPARP